jgi:PhnB protein
MQVQPYLNFDGRCDEALDFYAKAIGAKVGCSCVSRRLPTSP